MSAVLQFFRDQEPGLKSVSDADLSAFVAETYPEFMQEPEFAATWQQHHATSLRPMTANQSPTPYQPYQPAQQGASAEHIERLTDAARGGFGVSPTLEAQRLTGRALTEQDRQQLVDDALASNPMTLAGRTLARGGKTLLAGVADLEQSAVEGQWQMPNLSSYAENPEAPLPIQETINDMRGPGRYVAKAAESLTAMWPQMVAGGVLGRSAGALVNAGRAGQATAGVAGALPFGFNERGQFDPTMVAVGAGVPIADTAARNFIRSTFFKNTVETLTPDAMRGLYQRVASNTATADEVKLVQLINSKVGKPKAAIASGVDVIQPGKWHPALQQAAEIAGGVTAANAYMLGVQLPGILGSENPRQALLDAVSTQAALTLTAAPGWARSVFQPRPSAGPEVRMRGAAVPAEEGAVINPEADGGITPPYGKEKYLPFKEVMPNAQEEVQRRQALLDQQAVSSQPSAISPEVPAGSSQPIADGSQLNAGAVKSKPSTPGAGGQPSGKSGELSSAPVESPAAPAPHSEILYPTEELNYRGGDETQWADVQAVSKNYNGQGKTVYVIQYGNGFVGFSPNPVWESHPGYTGESKYILGVKPAAQSPTATNPQSSIRNPQSPPPSAPPPMPGSTTPATITGSNEGQASEMPAEAGATPAPEDWQAELEAAIAQVRQEIQGRERAQWEPELEAAMNQVRQDLIRRLTPGEQQTLFELPRQARPLEAERQVIRRLLVEIQRRRDRKTGPYPSTEAEDKLQARLQYIESNMLAERRGSGERLPHLQTPTTPNAPTKFIGNLEIGEQVGKLYVHGNFAKKQDAVQAAGKYGVVKGYLNGKFKRGWLVLDPAPVPTTPPTTPAAPPQAGAGLNLMPAVERIAEAIKKGKITKKDVAAILEQTYGGTQAQGKFDAKDLGDAVEMAVNAIILRAAKKAPSEGGGLNTESPEAAIRTVGNFRRLLLERLPTQTTRTPEMDKLQQFSTPPHLAYVANWVANISPADVMLEPSAGVGGLAVFAKAAGARVLANELSPRRASLLTQTGIPDFMFGENAEHLNALLTPYIEGGTVPRPTVVVMNPPFSNAAKSGASNTIIGGKHVEEALKLLPKGGRLVAIVGEGMAMDRPRFKAWWAKIAQEYNVRANIGVSGKEYVKYGTSFGNQLVVIDKTGPTKDGTVTGQVERIEDLIPLLERIRNERPTVESSGRVEPPSTKPGGAGTPAGGTGSGGTASNPPAKPGVRRPGGRGGRKPGPAQPGTPNAGNGKPDGGDPTGGAAPSGGRTDAGEPASGPAAGTGGGGVAVPPQPGKPGQRPLDPKLAALYDALRAKLGGGSVKKMAAAGPRIDPEALTLAGQIAEMHAEAGIVKFSDFAQQVLSDVPDLWDKMKPYLLPAWSAAASLHPHIEELTRAQAAKAVEALENLPDADSTGPTPNPPPHPTKADAKMGLSVEQAVKGQQTLNEHGVFSEYAPRKLRLAGAKDHPTPLVEPTAMAAVDPVDVTYRPHLPQERIEAGFPSLTQLEQVVYAGQAHQKILPDGTRMGYFIGDGTGVGKGVTLGAIILDNWNQGRRKAVWVSAKSGLIKDAKRDLADLGFDVTKVLDMKPNNGKAIVGAREGVAFLPYTSLKMNNPGVDPRSVDAGQPKLYPAGHKKAGAVAKAGEKTKTSRLQMLHDWLGPDFDGVIIFDEAHKAGNAMDIKGSRGVERASQTALAVLDVQKLFPKARIVYSSATGATQVKNLAYAERLGLWGVGTPFDTKQKFINTIVAGGLSAMEIVARDLKAMGRYLARTLSFEGVDNRALPHALTPEQVKLYDDMARGWQTVMQSVADSLAQTGGSRNGQAISAANSALWGAQQRFYNQLLTALQLPTVLTDMKAELAKGHSIVLQLVNTNEATLSRELAEKGSEANDEEDNSYLESLDLSPKDTLLQYIDNSYPVQLYEPVADSQGNVTYQPVRDKDGKPVQDPAAIARKRALMDRIALIPMPANPLEQIFDTFGVDNVAEITGRSKRVVLKKDDTGTMRRVLETNRGESHRQADAKAFEDGKKRILMFSGAGGTGFTFSASLKFKNQQRRKHYLLQAGWRADEATQGLGRSHRSNQASAPEFILPSTDLKGHQRFISTIARRLAELGALTGGERKAAGGQMFDENSNLEDQYAEDAVEAFFVDLFNRRVEGMDFAGLTERMGFVRKVINDRTGEMTTIYTLIDPKTGALNRGKIPSIQQFLNRILSLTVDEQNRVFDEFDQRRARRIENAKRDGSYDPGTQTLKALDIRKLGETLVWESKENTAATKLVEVEHDHPTQINRFPGEYEKRNDYVINRRSGRVYSLGRRYSSTSEQGGVGWKVVKMGPTSHELAPEQDIQTAIQNGNLVRVSESEAIGLWNSEIAKAPKTRTYKETYLTGALLPIWDRIQISYPKVWRITPSNSDAFLGVHIPAEAVPDLRDRLGAGSGAGASPETVFWDILDRGRTVELVNGWKLKRVRIQGEQRIEVTGLDHHQQSAGLFGDDQGKPGIYGFTERIAWIPRFFVPTEEAAGIAAITKILEKAPELVKAANVSQAMQGAPGASGTLASRGYHVQGFAVKSGTVPATVKLGGMNHVRAIEMPELVKLARQMLGGDIKLKKPRGKAVGIFGTIGNHGFIQLDPKLFANPIEAAQVLAHELGHGYDWFDSKTGASRGNIWGHIGALNLWLRQKFGKSGVTSKELKAELIALTEYWRPFDRTTAPPSFVEYRESPEELYADALSVLFNSPGLLQEKAPKFYKAFFEALDQRPEAKAHLMDAWNLLHTGKVGALEQRQADIEAMFGRGDEMLRKKWETRRARSRFEGWWPAFRQLFVWEYDPIAMKLPEMIPMMEEYALSDNINGMLARNLFDRVIQPAEAFGITQGDLGTILFLERVAAGDTDAAKMADMDPDMKAALGRQGIANPLGQTPATAKQGLMKWRLDHGLGAWTIAKASLDALHELHYGLAEEAVKVGAYSQAALRAVITPNRHNYAAFGLIEHLETYVPAGLARQRGTLEEIANPLTITMLKMFSMNNVIALQRVKNQLRDLLLATHRADIEAAPTPVIGNSADGRALHGEPRRKEGRGLLMVLEDGQRAYYHVDPYIAACFERSPLIEHIAKALTVLDWIYRRFMYPFQITYNIAFQAFTNPTRDIARTWNNLPAGVLPGRQMPHLLKVFAAARLPAALARKIAAAHPVGAGGTREYLAALARAEAQKDPILQEMVANFAFGLPFEVQAGGAVRDNALDEIARRYRLLPGEKDSAFWQSAVGSALLWFQKRGQINEALSKIATYRLLRKAGWQPKQAAYFVRNYAGTPNIHRKGQLHMVTRAFIPFYNVFLQGWRNDLERMHPKSDSGWIFKFAMTDGLMATITALISAGAFGAAFGLKDLFDRISEYDKSTYNVIPVGMKLGGEYGFQAVFFRMPRSEQNRLMAGLLYKAIRASAGENPGQWGGLLDFGGGQFPTVNPAITIPAAWGVAMAGGKPTDTLRGRPVIPQREWSAGGASVLEPMFQWSLSQSGLNSLVSWNPRAATTTEFLFSAVPGINRIVKVSDYGMREQQQQDDVASQSARDREYLKLPQSVQALNSEYSRLQQLGPRRNSAQETRYNDLKKWHHDVFSPADEAIRSANSTIAPLLRSRLEKDSNAWRQK